jgi:hypothetical protein
VRAVWRRGQHFVEQLADRGDDIEIGALAVAADIVALAWPASGQDRVQRAGVVLDIKPVAHIVALAVNRDRLAVQRLQDRQRDQFFGEMVGPVIVRAVAHHSWQPVGLVPGPHQMVGGRLRGGIGRVRLIPAGLPEFAVGPERAEHFVRRDMVKAEAGGAVGGQRAPVIQRLLEQRVGALDISLDEFAGAIDRAVDMRLGGKMQHRVRLERAQQPGHGGAVADIAAMKAIARVVLDRLQRIEIGGIGQLVEIQHLGAGLADQQPTHRRADKPGPACH